MKSYAKFVKRHIIYDKGTITKERKLHFPFHFYNQGCGFALCDMNICMSAGGCKRILGCDATQKN